jgi:DNA-directed RNA polymerase specialized sigma24 family protein
VSHDARRAGAGPGNPAEGRDLLRRVRRIAAGDREAAAWLYDTFAPGLYRRLRQRYEPLGLDPEDLLQDAFAFYFRDDGKVLRDFSDRVDRSEAAVTPRALERHLWDLACGVASNARRTAWRRRVVPITRLARLPSGRDAGAERRALARDTLRRIEECLRAASPRVALYYALRFRDGLSPSEVAETTGWSPKATYKLRQSLNEAVARCADQLDIDLG